MSDLLALAGDLIGDRADEWDRHGRLPEDMLRQLGAAGVLCAQIAPEYGGPGLDSRENGELTAHVAALCGSTRSIMTAQGIAAWTAARHGREPARTTLLRQLTGGQLASVALSEAAAGSDLSAMRTQIRLDGDTVVVSGHKVWVTGASYSDTLLVYGRAEDGTGAVVLVPATASGVRVTPVPEPLGCRAAGHAHVDFDQVRLNADALLCAGTPLMWLVTSALAYGRLSVAWGCAGMVRACREAAVRHARTRHQFGTPLARHQLVAGHLADLWAAEQTATRICEYASDCWDTAALEMVAATVLAKYVAADLAARGAAAAVQVLGSAGVPDGQVVARAYRDAKVMEIIEGSTELCQLLLADHALAVTP